MKGLLFLLINIATFSFAGAVTRGQENAVWCGSVFLRGFDPTTKVKLSEKSLEELADRLKRHQIKYVYLFAGPFESSGRLPEYASSKRARKSVSDLKRLDPDLKVIAWVGGVEGKTVHLENEAWLAASIRATGELVEKTGFDGVHTDFEYVLFPKKITSGVSAETFRANWIGFHKQARKRLPTGFLSTSVVSTASTTTPWKLKLEIKDLANLAGVLNQVAFMFYDTHLHMADSYRAAMAEQLSQIKDLKSLRGGDSPQYLFGIGTFEAEKSLRAYRDMKVENVKATLADLRELTGEKRFSNVIDGLAIYAEWTTGPDDWKQIREFWIH